VGGPVMNAREVERELTDVLHRHAEDAMNRTDTHDEHARFQAAADGESWHRSRRLWLVCGVAATVVAIVGFALWSVGSDHRADSGPTRDTQTPAESVADGLVNAVAARDADRARQFVVPALLPDVRSGMRLQQAFSWEMFPQPCAETGTAPNGTTVLCTFEFHQLHSEQLGLGPFINNSFTLRVKDGRVVEASVFIPEGPDGAQQMEDRIGAWVRAHHPRRWALMAGEPKGTPAQTQRWYRLWKVYSQEYADAMTREGSGGASPTG
jgi:hypothetical protein